MIPKIGGFGIYVPPGMNYISISSQTENNASLKVEESSMPFEISDDILKQFEDNNITNYEFIDNYDREIITHDNILKYASNSFINRYINTVSGVDGVAYSKRFMNQ
jgi:hypothetical protein